MDPAERPPQELIDGAATAVKYRNEIMHALRNSSGGYRIRTRTNAELSDAYSAALKLFDYYRKALERLVPTPTAGGVTGAWASPPDIVHPSGRQEYADVQEPR